jgi:hypothetical protein
MVLWFCVALWLAALFYSTKASQMVILFCATIHFKILNNSYNKASFDIQIMMVTTPEAI